MQGPTAVTSWSIVKKARRKGGRLDMGLNCGNSILLVLSIDNSADLDMNAPYVEVPDI